MQSVKSPAVIQLLFTVEAEERRGEERRGVSEARVTGHCVKHAFPRDD